MSDTKNNVDLNKNDELIKKEVRFFEVVAWKLIKKRIGLKKFC